jgi:3-oxoacyl-[acyl-carrier protein] reductase
MNDRVAMVTGGSRGIGRAIVTRLAAAGFAIGVVYVSRDAEALSTVAEIEGRGGRAVAVRADVADEDDMERAFDTLERRWGGVDVLVNCAGVLLRTPLTEFSLDDFDAVVRTNLRGAFVATRLAARRIRDGGSIVNLSSTAVATALPGYAGYVAAKAGVEALTLIVARELGSRGITVNTVAPGPTATEMFFADKDEATVSFMRGLSPLGRLGTADDIADVAVFLVTEGRWVNGQVIRVNGGVA